AHGATDQAAQHVAAALVAGTHAVADQHQRAAHVVADDAQVDVVLLVRAVAAAGELLRLLDDGEDLVDLVHVLLALQQVGEALDAEAGVDRLLVELAEQLVVLALARTAQELVEDEVPDLEIAVLGALVAGPLGQAAGGGVGAVLRAAVVVPLPGGAGGAGLAGVPAALLPGQLHDPRGVQADDLHEVVVGLLV